MQKLQKTLLAALILLACSWPVTAAVQDSQTVTSEGEAAIEGSQAQARELAIAQANRLAVEQAMGVYVVSETLVQNAVVVKDEILTKASGFISGYKIITEKVQGKIYRVKIQATVSVEPLVEQLAKMGLLREWTVAVILAPPDGKTAQESTESARTKLNSSLLEMGFKVADENALVQLSQPALMAQIMKGNYMAALPTLRDNGVDVLIAGKTFTRPTETGAMETYGGLKTILTEGRIDARVIRVDTGELLAAKSFNGLAGGSTQAIAEAKAIEKAAGDAGGYFSKQIAKLPASTTQMVQLKVKGLSFAREKLFQEAVRKVSGVRKLTRKLYRNQEAQYEIEFAGKADNLADLLSENAPLKKFGFEILSLSSGRIDAKGK
jgi:hypothetical protein